MERGRRVLVPGGKAGCGHRHPQHMPGGNFHPDMVDVMPVARGGKDSPSIRSSPLTNTPNIPEEGGRE